MRPGDRPVGLAAPAYRPGFGSLQVIISATALGVLAYPLAGTITGGALIGAALALSSTAIVMPVLAEQKRLHAEGRPRDLLGAAVPGPGGGADPDHPGRLARGDGVFRRADLLALGPAAIGLGVIVLLGRLVLRPMMRSVAKAKSEELFMAACLLVVIGAGLVTALAGLSMALGAFVAGLLLAETEYRHEVEVTIEPFKGLLLGLFFVSVGIGLDLSLLVAPAGAGAWASALGLLARQGGDDLRAGPLFGLTSRAPHRDAPCLAAGGEFAFVILDKAMARRRSSSERVGQTVLVAATLSMFLIPALRPRRRALRPRGGGRPGAATAPGTAGAEHEDAGRVLVVGYGRVGRLVGDMLDRHDLPWIAVDRDPALSSSRAAAPASRSITATPRGRSSSSAAACDQRRAVVVTMDTPDAAEAVVGRRPQASAPT